jgi:glycosyltransferase involved in cell wall biosynthesis
VIELVYVGRVARQTGICQAVHGLRMARQRGVEACLTIAGSGEDELHIRQLVERLGLQSAVRFPGPVFGEARLQLLRAADVSILPVCEAALLHALNLSLTAGVPVIAWRTGGATDAIVDGAHGLLMRTGEPEEFCQTLCELAANRALLPRLRDACRHWRATGEEARPA